MWTFRATVLRIVDGDTVELSVDRGERIWIYTYGIYYLVTLWDADPNAVP